ncbi:MAG: hypothetical protein ABSG69_14940, partial [Candidatus Acidiferrum sp.]
MGNSCSEKNEKTSEKGTLVERRQFLQTAAASGLIGAMMAPSVLAQSSSQVAPVKETREQLRQDMMAGIEDDIKKDLEMRAQSNEELPKPAGLRPGGMLDARFSVYYKTSVPEAMRLLTTYFAAFSDRDMAGVASTLHFPYATYEGTEPLVYQSAKEFIDNPPPSLFESSKPDSQLRPNSYDIMDVLNLQTFNPVNVGLEMCTTRYRADGYRIGINQGIYAVTNNDGKWGIQLSSVIFTPTEFIGQKYDDALEAHLRQGRTSMAAFGDHDYELLTKLGWGSGRRDSKHKIASITGAPGATTFFLSGWAGKPMQPYNSKGRVSRLTVTGMDNVNALAADNDPIAKYERP